MEKAPCYPAARCGGSYCCRARVWGLQGARGSMSRAVRKLPHILN